MARDKEKGIRAKRGVVAYGLPVKGSGETEDETGVCPTAPEKREPSLGKGKVSRKNSLPEEGTVACR